MSFPAAEQSTCFGVCEDHHRTNVGGNSAVSFPCVFPPPPPFLATFTCFCWFYLLQPAPPGHAVSQAPRQHRRRPGGLRLRRGPYGGPAHPRPEGHPRRPGAAAHHLLPREGQRQALAVTALRQGGDRGVSRWRVPRPDDLGTHSGVLNVRPGPLLFIKPGMVAVALAPFFLRWNSTLFGAVPHGPLLNNLLPC